MVSLQSVLDAETLSQLNKIITEANTNSWTYYLLTLIITILGTSLGVYCGFISSKKQEKSKQKEYLKNRMKYLIRINENLQDIWLEQKNFFNEYINHIRKRPYDTSVCQQSLHISNFQKLKEMNNEDLYHSCLLFINNSDDVRVDEFNNLSDNIDLINRVIFDTIKMTSEIHQEITTKAYQLPLKLSVLETGIKDKSLHALLIYDKKMVDASDIFMKKYNEMKYNNYPIDHIINELDNLQEVIRKYSYKKEYQEIFDMLNSYIEEYYNFKSYIEIYSGALDTSISIADKSIYNINNVILNLESGIKNRK